jgi:pSer/pThr/pTyr-binding forkhead associated (FHA) protein
MGGPATAPVSVTAPASSAPASDDACPQCGTARTAADKFCEVCGYDFLARQAAEAPKPAPAATSEPATPSAAASEPKNEAPASAPSGATWQIVVRADRARYDADVPDAPPVPDKYNERTVALTGDRLLIGRESQSRGIHPDLDLSGQPEDTGISRSHATLVHQKDGSYAIVDDGSTNGTHVNDGVDPIARGEPVVLADGDRVYIGAWTVLEVQRIESSAD